MDLQIIKSLAKENKITLRELSQKIGMSEQGLHRSIRTNSIAAEYLENIARCFGVSVGVFYGEKQPTSTNKVSAKIFQHYVDTFFAIINNYISGKLTFDNNKKVSNINDLKRWIKDYKKQDTEFNYMSELIINVWKLTEEDFAELQKAGVITKKQSILKLWARFEYDIKSFVDTYSAITANEEMYELRKIYKKEWESKTPQFIKDILREVENGDDSEPHARIYVVDENGEHQISKADLEKMADNNQ